MKTFMRRWAKENGRFLAMFLVLDIGLVVFYPADLDVKLRVAVISLALVVGASFIPDLGKRKKRPLDEMRAEADSRAVEELPAAASIDVMRPLLAVRRTGDGPIRIYMIYVPKIPGEVPILVSPEYKFKFRQRHEIVALPDFAHLRKYLNEQDLRVVPQSGLSDELGPTLFGDDWREE